MYIYLKFVVLLFWIHIRGTGTGLLWLKRHSWLVAADHAKPMSRGAAIATRLYVSLAVSPLIVTYTAALV